MPGFTAAPEACDRARCDSFGSGELPTGVVRPESVAELIDTARALFGAGHRIFLRGGGLSYIDCFRPDTPDSVVLDLGALDGVEEINARDGYVIVQPGCRWKTLHAALKTQGQRARFWGTFPGAVSTVGGSIAQDACHYGSAESGAAGESVLGVEVLLPTGELIRTGAWARRGGTPFARSFGPDLTGLFVNDSGALGLKTRIALRLRPYPAHVRGVSIGYVSLGTLLRDMEAVGPLRLADNVVFDRRLCLARFSPERIRQMARQAPTLLAGQAGIPARLRLALAGARGLVSDYTRFAFVAHFTIEGDSAGLMREKVRLFRSRLSGEGRRLAPLFPLAMAAEPFSPPGTILGPSGEIAAPVHAKLAFSAVAACDAAITAMLSEEAEAMQLCGVWSGLILELIGSHEMLYEPIFYLRGPLNAQQAWLTGRPAGDATPEAAAARDVVERLRARCFRIFAEHGAAHFHLGAEIPFGTELLPGTRALLHGLRQCIDPRGLLNQTALAGLAP